MPHMPSIALLAMLSALVPLSGAIAKDIAVTPDQIQQLEIKLEPVRPAVNAPLAVLPATVIPAQNARVAATAPYSGTVVQMHVLPGQKVQQGDPIATIASRDLLEAQSQIAQSEAELQAATAIADRKRQLADKNIMSATMAQEAEAQVAKVRAVLAQHKAAVAIGGIESRDGGQYVIHAPAAGTIAHVGAMTGEPISAMSAAVSIDTSDEVWLEAQIPAAMVSRIRVGDMVEVVDGPRGKILSIGHNIEKLTRSAQLIASVPAESGLMPGQMVKLNLLQSAEAGTIQLPASAVAWISGEYQIFTRNENGFSMKPVSLHGKSLNTATISGEVAAGDMVAASGLPQLEAILSGKE